MSTPIQELVLYPYFRLSVILGKKNGWQSYIQWRLYEYLTVLETIAAYSLCYIATYKFLFCRMCISCCFCCFCFVFFMTVLLVNLILWKYSIITKYISQRFWRLWRLMNLSSGKFCLVLHCTVQWQTKYCCRASLNAFGTKGFQVLSLDSCWGRWRS